MHKKIIKIIAIALSMLIVLLAALFACYKLYMDPYRGTVGDITPSASLDEMLSGDEAREDLAYMMDCLRDRHPAWLDGSGKDVPVEKQYEEELSAIGNELSVLELYQTASRIMAKLHDGHSYVKWQNDEQERYINDFAPLSDYGTPSAIDDIPISELFSVYKERSSYELEAYAEEVFINNVIVCDSLLRLCGVDTSDGVVMNFEQGGAVTELSFDLIPLWAVKGYSLSSGGSKWVFHEIDEENNLGIFSLRSCQYNEEYLSTLDGFFAEVFEKGIENIVVDLRGNGGGNSMVANKFIEYLDIDSYQSWDSAVRYGWYLLKNEDISYTNNKRERVFDGELFVLTDTRTYSAAMDFAMLITDNDIGTIVGQPSGNMPDGFGDCLYFQMPNSQLLLSVSYKKWFRIDSEKAGEAIMPDVEVDSNKALEKVYELILN